LIDFSALGSGSGLGMKVSLVNRLMEIAEEYNLEISKDHIIEDITRSFINALTKKSLKIIGLQQEHHHF